MLALVVALFAILWLPYRGLLVYNSLASMFGGALYMQPWFLMFAKTCIFINSAINPILYNAMSTKFRNEFRKLLVCGGSEDTRHNLGGSSRYQTASNLSRIHTKVTDLEL
ncbi:thyrotropin-releasing hormone receptor [Nilaparvata lugens]|nr:thyrotropin-releasing hormone receptor [Nilaparvata lugens]